MPTRTVLPTISITWTTTSSPTMIFSPARRVMSSMLPPWISCGRWMEGGGLRRGGDGGEQRGAHGGVRRLVDDLVALALGDDDRRAQVGVEVRELGAGANRDPDGDVLGGRGDRLRVGVGELDGVVGEERPGVGDRQRHRRIVERVQPAQGAVLGAGHERVARAAEADQAVRELDDVLGRDLERAEARGVKSDGGHSSARVSWREGEADTRFIGYLRRSISDASTMFAPARNEAW